MKKVQAFLDMEGWWGWKLILMIFSKSFRAGEKHFAFSLSDSPFFSISWFQIMFLLLLISDVIWVTIYSWVMTVNTGGPLLCFLSSLKGTVPDHCGCFCGWLSPQFTNFPPAHDSSRSKEGQIRDGNAGWKSTGVLWLCWAGINISPLIRTWLRPLKRQDMCVGSPQNLHSGYDSLLEGDTVTSEVEILEGEAEVVRHLFEIRSGGEGHTGLS